MKPNIWVFTRWAFERIGNLTTQISFWKWYTLDKGRMWILITSWHACPSPEYEMLGKELFESFPSFISCAPASKSHKIPHPRLSSSYSESDKKKPFLLRRIQFPHFMVGFLGTWLLMKRLSFPATTIFLKKNIKKYPYWPNPYIFSPGPPFPCPIAEVYLGLLSPIASYILLLRFV